MQVIKESLNSRCLPPLAHYEKAKNLEKMSILVLRIAKVDCRFDQTRLLLLTLEYETRTPRIEPAMITWSVRWREKRGALVSFLFNLVDERMSEFAFSQRLQHGSSDTWPPYGGLNNQRLVGLYFASSH
jgi:hypothetical protein